VLGRGFAELLLPEPETVAQPGPAGGDRSAAVAEACPAAPGRAGASHWPPTNCAPRQPITWCSEAAIAASDTEVRPARREGHRAVGRHHHQSPPVGGRHRREPGPAPSYPIIVGVGFRVAKLYQMLPVSVSGDPGAHTPRTTIFWMTDAGRLTAGHGSP